MKKFITSILILFLSPGILYADGNLWVQSKKTKIMDEPSFSSKIITVVTRGDKLSLIKKSSGWYKVSTGSTDGWINGFAVSKSPPIQRVTVITGNEENIGKLSRKRPSSFTTAAAARGLSDEDRARLQDKSNTDYPALEKLIEVSKEITEDDLKVFAAFEK